MLPIDTAKLKRQIATLREQLDHLSEKADEVARVESARSNSFLGLMSDLRDLASEIDHYAPKGATIPEGTLTAWADKPRAMGKARFDAYIENRDTNQETTENERNSVAKYALLLEEILTAYEPAMQAVREWKKAHAYGDPRERDKRLNAALFRLQGMTIPDLDEKLAATLLMMKYANKGQR